MVEIQQFLDDTSKGIIPVNELTSLAANRRAFGDDIIAAFRTQIELRSNAAQAVLTAAEPLAETPFWRVNSGNTTRP